MKGIFLLIFFLVYLSSLSQIDCLQIKNESGQPIKYATISIGNNKAYLIGDSSGRACKKSSNFIQKGDTLFVSAVGYHSKRIVYQSGETIFLKTNIVTLPGVILVKGEGKNEVWGTKGNPGLFGFGSSIGFGFTGSIIGRMVFPEGNVVQAKVQSVSFYDSKGKGLDVPVRLRIYAIGKDSLPLGDYLNDNIIVRTKGKGWLEINLMDKDIYMTKEGLIFAIELFADDVNYYYLRKDKLNTGKKISTKMYGISLGTEKTKEFLSVFKFNSATPWIIDRVMSNSSGNIVCRVKLKVWR